MMNEHLLKSAHDMMAELYNARDAHRCMDCGNDRCDHRDGLEARHYAAPTVLECNLCVDEWKLADRLMPAIIIEALMYNDEKTRAAVEAKAAMQAKVLGARDVIEEYLFTLAHSTSGFYVEPAVQNAIRILLDATAPSPAIEKNHT